MNDIKININQMVENNVTVNAKWMLAEITEKVKEWEFEEDVEKDILTKWENSLNNLHKFDGSNMNRLQRITVSIQSIYRLWLEDYAEACEDNEDGFSWVNEEHQLNIIDAVLAQLCNDCEIDNDVLRAELGLIMLKTSIKDDVLDKGYVEGNSIVWGF